MFQSGGHVPTITPVEAAHQIKNGLKFHCNFWVKYLYSQSHGLVNDTLVYSMPLSLLSVATACLTTISNSIEIGNIRNEKSKSP